MASSLDCVRLMPPDGTSDFFGETEDGIFGIRIPAEVLVQITGWCQAAKNCETGGILVGSYTRRHTVAEVVEALPATPDSKAGRIWFFRGVAGLNRLLNRYWKRKRLYYLGEWHFHPSGRPISSPRDCAQMQEIAQCDQYACPEPVLLVIGGTSGSWTFGAFVFPRNSPCAELIRRRDGAKA